MAKVYFIKAKAGGDLSDLPQRVARLAEAVGMPGCVGLDPAAAKKPRKADDWSPRPFFMLKTHFGEMKNDTYVKAAWIRPIVDSMKSGGAKVLVSDTNTLYVGSRSNAVDHLETAYKHGFTHEALGAPVIIADGLLGENQSPVEVNLRNYDKVFIANDARAADGLVVTTNITGHCEAAFAGSIKNIGMGLAGRGGKRSQHCDLKPQVIEANCVACGMCVEWCPGQAITVGKTAQIDEEKCIGCGECHSVCQNDAILFEWTETSAKLQEKVTEHAYAVLKDKKGMSAFFNFMTAVTLNCNCFGITEKPEIPPIGVLASTDVVAADQAAADIVNRAFGADLFKKLYPDREYDIQMAYAEEIGLGSRKYELVEVA